MREIAPQLYQLEGLRQANVYLLAGDHGLTLIDTGTAADAGSIVADVEGAGYNLSDIKTIVVTHSHGDHTGSLAELASRTSALVAAHRIEAPFIDGSQSMPADTFGRRVMNWLSNLIARSEPCAVDHALEDGDMLDALGGLRVVHAPGHTPGSIVLYQPERKILIAGDVIFHGNPITGGEIQAPPRMVSVDPVQAEASARAVAALDIEVACFGHGEPILESAGQRIREALA